VSSLLETENLDIWTTTTDHIDVRATSLNQVQQTVGAQVDAKWVHYEVIIQDIEKSVLQPEWKQMEKSILRQDFEDDATNPMKWFQDYHQFADIVACTDRASFSVIFKVNE
jgi:hypothetical protein